MENKIQNVSLSFCCKKDWNTFETVDENIRFCDSCQHTVVDFTTATQNEFDNALKQGRRICGRFTGAQLNNNFLKYATSSLAVAVTILSASCANPPDVARSDAASPSIPEQFPLVEEHGFVTMGEVVMPLDSAWAADTLRTTIDNEPTE